MHDDGGEAMDDAEERKLDEQAGIRMTSATSCTNSHGAIGNPGVTVGLSRFLPDLVVVGRRSSAIIVAADTDVCTVTPDVRHVFAVSIDHVKTPRVVCPYSSAGIGSVGRAVLPAYDIRSRPRPAEHRGRNERGSLGGR